MKGPLAVQPVLVVPRGCEANDFSQIERWLLQSPPPCSGANRPRDTFRAVVNVSTATRKGLLSIHGGPAFERNHSEEIVLRVALTTTQAPPVGIHTTPLGLSGRFGLFPLHHGVGLDVNFCAGQLGGQPGVLALFADGQRKLIVGNERPNLLGVLVDDEGTTHLCR
jgi:hypothetical protein